MQEDGPQVVWNDEQVSDVADEDGRHFRRGKCRYLRFFKPFWLPGVATLRTGFRPLKSVNLVEVQERACLMKSVPRFLRGPCRIAVRAALEEMVSVIGRRT